MGISSAMAGAVGSVPAGAVLPFAGANAPAGWLLCAGQAVSRTQYGELFAVIGTTYGNGDGSTTFSLPDLRGRVIAGEDDMGGTAANRLTFSASGVSGNVLGATGGSQTHTLTTNEMPNHTHSAAGAASVVANSNNNLFMGAGNPPVGTVGSVNAAGGGAAHNNVQPTMVMNYIIRAWS